MQNNKNDTDSARLVALDALRAICADPEARESDRIAAAKLLLEHSFDDGPSLRVTMDLPKEYLS